MITAGIDVGAKTVKVVLMEDGKIKAKAKVLSGFDQEESAKAALGQALMEAGLPREAIGSIVTTGNGRKAISYATDDVTEARAAALGAVFLYPSARTVIDVGAEESRAIKCDPSGKVLDFAVNEKCAAGSGAFTEAMARALEVPLEELGPLSLRSTQTIPMNAQCTVFAESEVVSLIHSKTQKADIARAVHDGLSSRVVAMVRRVGLDPELVLVGGVAHNPGFVESFKRTVGLDNVRTAEEPEFVAAIGAALTAG
ncbi:MAG: CoA activase [Deltaproteobacteria bacterium RIFCSPHIGHO2_02_FULL_60_17]|nr:MAG: CoA activase [Deltaproteobacteria bacterium RIFCSPHIGHO2_02_FULL_60_17]